MRMILALQVVKATKVVVMNSAEIEIQSAKCVEANVGKNILAHCDSTVCYKEAELVVVFVMQ